MPIPGIKKGLGGSFVYGEVGRDANPTRDIRANTGKKIHSSCRQLPVACPEPDGAEPSLFRRPLHRPRIPLVIHCAKASESSSVADFKQKSPRFAKPKSPKKDTDYNPVWTCLKLLESDCYDDNRLGIEHLVMIVNRELVDSKWKGSVAESLILRNFEDVFSKRIRYVFPSFFTDEFLYRKSPNHQQIVKKESETQESQSTGYTSLYSDLSDSTGRRHRRSLKLPALRVFVSSLELISTRPGKKSIDLSDPFWKCMLTYMVDSLEERNLGCLESVLYVKGFRLLLKVDPQTFHCLIKESILPLVVGVKEHGKEKGDKMLVRECDRLLLVYQ